jgi:hypothetical protein
MPTYATPGVYVEEIPARSKPIEGVSTSTAAFVGLAPGGPVNRPVEISNWSQFERVYGDPADPRHSPFMEGAYLAHAVNGFFANGGQLCWVVRVGTENAPPPRAALPAADDPKTMVLEVTAKNVEDDVKVSVILDPPGRAQIPASANGAGAKSSGSGKSPEEDRDTQGGGAAKDAAKEDQPSLPPKTYTISIQAGTGKAEKHEHVLAAEIPNLTSEFVTLGAVGTAGLEPMPGTYYPSVPPIPASDVTTSDVEGDVARREGLGSLAAVVDVSMVCVPDLVAIAADDDFLLKEAQGQVIAHCENMGDRMAILDTPPGKQKPSDALDWLLNTANYDSKQATLYYPWVEVMNPLTKLPMFVPPCGHVAGVWARTDSTRGVHKAPANEGILGITGIGYQVTDAEQGDLNRSGLNCIRAFSGRGIRVWGARTISSDPEWRYINVRRLFNFVSDSIMRGTQWAVFEPNDERLWIQLQIAVTNFLTIQWRNGALFGGHPEEAFYVKCDSETNPPELIEAGQVTTEVGIAPVKPAEFVVFRISQYTAGEGAAA